MNKFDDLEKLGELKKKGVLTDKEFQIQKERLLDGPIEYHKPHQNVWDYYVGCLKKYAVFRGRASRAEYWSFFLMNFLIGLILGVLTVIWESSALSVLYSLAVLIPGLAVCSRRFHDVQISATWFFVPYAILLFLLVVLGVLTGIGLGLSDPSDAFYIMLGGLWILVSVFAVVFGVACLIVTLLPGTAGPNRYGPAPVPTKEKALR